VIDPGRRCAVGNIDVIGPGDQHGDDGLTPGRAGFHGRADHNITGTMPKSAPARRVSDWSGIFAQPFGQRLVHRVPRIHPRYLKPFAISCASFALGGATTGSVKDSQTPRRTRASDENAGVSAADEDFRNDNFS